MENELEKYDIDSPGIILQAAEKYFFGCNAEECILNTPSSEIDTLKLCNNISKGNWPAVKVLMKHLRKEDIVMIRNCVLGYLKTVLFAAKDEKALSYAKAMQIIGIYCDELPIFLANICIACDIIATK